MMLPIVGGPFNGQQRFVRVDQVRHVVCDEPETNLRRCALYYIESCGGTYFLRHYAITYNKAIGLVFNTYRG